MPKGLPSASDLMENKSVTFFSIDTDIIQSLGFKFNEGALRALHLQCPAWIKVRLTEIVQREVMAHRMAPVKQAIQELNTAMSKVGRSCGHDVSEIEETINNISLEEVTREKFSNEFLNFCTTLRGSVLPIDGKDLAKNMFERYFLEVAPFEARKDKKHEFPDAAALLVLENFAEKNNTQGILISRDNGWSSFAETSKDLYCVKTLEEFVSIFESKGGNADALKKKAVFSLKSENDDFFSQVKYGIESHFSGADWNVSDVYSSFNLRAEAVVEDARCESIEFSLDNLSIWLVEHDTTVCTIEVPANVKIELRVLIEFYRYDSLDGDEVNVGSNELSTEIDLDVDVVLVCTGDLLEAPVEEWDVTVGVSGDNYRVEIGEVNPDYREDWD